jgi:hypothetical protein
VRQKVRLVAACWLGFLRSSHHQQGVSWRGTAAQSRCLASFSQHPASAVCFPALQASLSCCCCVLLLAAAVCLPQVPVRGHMLSKPTSRRVYSLMCGCVHTCTHQRPLPPARSFVAGTQAGCRCPAGLLSRVCWRSREQHTHTAVRSSCVAVPWGVAPGWAGHMRGRRPRCAGNARPYLDM